MLRRLLGLFRRKPRTTNNRNNKTSHSPRRSPARNNVQRVNSPHRKRNNNQWVQYNGQTMTAKGMAQKKEYNRLLRAGYPNAVAWKAVGGRSIYN